MRMKRIFRDDGRTLIVAIDHPLWHNSFPTLERPLDVIVKVAQGGADAVLISLGTVRDFCEKIPRDLGVILSVPPDPRFVRTADILGIHAIKNTFFGSLDDKKLELLYPLAVECEEWEMPFLAEIVPTDAQTRKPLYDAEQIKIAARMASEFGADFVKTSYPGSVESFKEVVENCPVPVIALGGSKMDNDRAVLEIAKGTIDAGGAGIAFGRNIFQHRNPTAITRAIARIIHEKADVKTAMSELE